VQCSEFDRNHDCQRDPFGLLPILWSPATQAGADVMKRIATPMIGGVITSAILELLIYPVIYVTWRKRSLIR
jgi:Cu(I)/Ag(I) efflux system membrane protein CusA/SilA